jgi:hypothetical protein
MKKEKKSDFSTCLQVGVGSRSGSGSASKWKVVSGSASRSTINSKDLHKKAYRNIFLFAHHVSSVVNRRCLSRIRIFSIPDTGSEFFPFRIPDPNFLYPGSEFFPSRIRIKECKYRYRTYFNPKRSDTVSDPYMERLFRIRARSGPKFRIRPNSDPKNWHSSLPASVYPDRGFTVLPEIHFSSDLEKP